MTNIVEMELERPVASLQKLTDSLIHLLSQGTEAECCLALQTIGDIRDPRSAAPLIDQLRNDDPDIRSDAASALGKLGDASAIAPLMSNLRDDPEGENKSVYIRALQALKAYQSIKMLISLVRGRGEDQGISWDDEYSEWDDWLDVQLAAIEALGEMAQAEQQSDAVAAIISALTDPDGQDLWPVACNSLARLGISGVGALGELIENASALNRKRIAKALTLVEREQSEPLLTRLAADSDATVRLAAIEAGAIHSLQSLYLSGLKDTSPDIRAACLTLYRAHTDDTILAALNDIAPNVRIAACQVIYRDGRERAGFGLVRRIQRGLRNLSPEVLAQMVAAAAIAEPGGARDLIEDITNHAATAPKVRIACLRAISKRPAKKTVPMLSEAAKDKHQDVRLEAISALGVVARENGPYSGDAEDILKLAIEGELIERPMDWQPDDDKIVEFVPKKGAQAAGEDGPRSISIDREGNILTEDKAPPKEEEVPSLVPAAPTSTLDAILSVKPASREYPDNQELAPQDLDYLQLTSTTLGKRRLNPETTTPAHVDIRRFAVQIAGHMQSSKLVPALAKAVLDNDRVLSELALDVLVRFADNGIDINAAGEELTRIASHSDPVLKAKGLRAAHSLEQTGITALITEALNDENSHVRAAAIEAAALRNAPELDLVALCQDPSAMVRRTAARTLAEQPAQDAVPALIQFALSGSGEHLNEGAKLLSKHPETAAEYLSQQIVGQESAKRLSLLNISKIMVNA